VALERFADGGVRERTGSDARAFAEGSMGAGGTCVHATQAVASMTAISSRKLVRAKRLIGCRAERRIVTSIGSYTAPSCIGATVAPSIDAATQAIPWATD